LFFGEGRTCTVRQQEIPVPTSVQPKPQPEPKLQAVSASATSQTSQKAVQTVILEDNFSDSLLNACVLNLLNITLSPIPGLPRLPPSARLPHCLCNWQAITADLWVFQVVRGYQLELMTAPHQRGTPCPLINSQQWMRRFRSCWRRALQ